MKRIVLYLCTLLVFLQAPVTSAGQELPVVVVFTIDFCPSCMATKHWLRERDIEYHELNVEQSERAREQFERISGRGIPTILVGKERIEGFNERRLHELLNVRH